MLYNAKTLSERLSQHVKDYKQGKALDFEQIFKDCEAAAGTIKSLRANGHTQKRKAQRLRKSNYELIEKIKYLE